MTLLEFCGSKALKCRHCITTAPGIPIHDHSILFFSIFPSLASISMEYFFYNRGGMRDFCKNEYEIIKIEFCTLLPGVVESHNIIEA